MTQPNNSTIWSSKCPLAVGAFLLLALVSTPLAAQDAIGTCGDLPDRLETCEPFECTFTHPFTGEEETRSIEPGDDDYCVYHESMPNDGEMICTYDNATRTRAAEFYRSYFTSGGPPDGNDLLNEAMADGTCKVSGY